LAFGIVWCALVGGYIWGSISPAEGQTVWIMELPSKALANDPGNGYSLRRLAGER
jgi:hypothetical protein